MSYDLHEGQHFSDENERGTLERSLKRCNGCIYASVAWKSCYKDLDNPKRLNTYTSGSGYIYLLREGHCPEYTPRRKYHDSTGEPLDS